MLHFVTETQSDESNKPDCHQNICARLFTDCKPASLFSCRMLVYRCRQICSARPNTRALQALFVLLGRAGCDQGPLGRA